MEYTIDTENGEISYRRFGSGHRIAVALHGYGEEGHSFFHLSAYLGNEYTVFCPDLPYHGHTKWKKNEMTIEDLYAIIDQLVPLSLRKITLIGYSMGGRMALALSQRYPEITERVVLIATDGLHNNFWYWFSTQTKIGNSVFARTMRNPRPLFKLMSAVHALGILNKSVFKFAHHYLDDDDARDKLFHRWTAFRTVKPSFQKFSTEKRFRTLLFFGRYDRIILPDRAKEAAKKNECIQVKMIHSGHQLLSEKHSKRIAELILIEL